MSKSLYRTDWECLELRLSPELSTLSLIWQRVHSIDRLDTFGGEVRLKRGTVMPINSKRLTELLRSCNRLRKVLPRRPGRLSTEN